jgi:restriction system protein
MGIAKDRMMAIEADVNRQLRLCAVCGERVEYEGDGKSWQAELSARGPFITVWLCNDCAENTVSDSCLRCHEARRPDAPICDNCLPDYTSEVEAQADDAECSRCGCSIPVEELDIFYESGMCGWCEHMSNKEERIEVVRDEEDWSPEKRLRQEEKLILTAADFRNPELRLITDPRLIAYIDSHPEELYSLTPRQFEEFIAELLSKMGYKVRLGPGSKDGGVDVFAERDQDFGPELTLVQCKRHNRDHKVGEPIIKQLHADVNDRRASKGLVVTSSFFTSTALKYIESSKYRLGGADFDKLQAWIARLRA